MRRSLVCAVAVLLLTPVPSEAWWDWIKELSGPGPSTSEFSAVATVCVFDWIPRDDPLTPTPPVKKDRKFNSVPCLFVDRREFVTNDDQEFPNRVRSQMFDVGVTWGLWDHRVEIGVGGGRARFRSSDLITNAGEKITDRNILTMPRIVVAPAAFLFGDTRDKILRRLSRMFKLHLRGNVIRGTINPEDFGVPFGTGPNQSTWEGAQNDFVFSGGVLVDFGELIYPLSRRSQ